MRHAHGVGGVQGLGHPAQQAHDAHRRKRAVAEQIPERLTLNGGARHVDALRHPVRLQDPGEGLLLELTDRADLRQEALGAPGVGAGGQHAQLHPLVRCAVDR